MDVILPHKMDIQPGLYLLSFKLGWILPGRTSDIDYVRVEVNMLIHTNGRDINTTNMLTSIDKSQQIKPDLQNLLNVEAIGI